MKKTLKIALLAFIVILSTIIFSAYGDYMALDRKSATHFYFTTTTFYPDVVKEVHLDLEAIWTDTEGNQGEMYIKDYYLKDILVDIHFEPQSIPDLNDDVTFDLVVTGYYVNTSNEQITFSIAGTGFAWGRGR